MDDDDDELDKSVFSTDSSATQFSSKSKSDGFDDDATGHALYVISSLGNNNASPSVVDSETFSNHEQSTSTTTANSVQLADDMDPSTLSLYI